MTTAAEDLTKILTKAVEALTDLPYAIRDAGAEIAAALREPQHVTKEQRIVVEHSCPDASERACVPRSGDRSPSREWLDSSPPCESATEGLLEGP